MRVTSEKAQVTAVIVCHEDSTINLDRAINIRHLGNKYNRWRVPLFVHTPRQEGMDALFSTSTFSRDPAQRIIPFGSAREHCDIKLLDYMDRLALTIHNDYTRLASQRHDDAHLLPANRLWNDLPLKLRVPNHRAADHAMVIAGAMSEGSPAIDSVKRVMKPARFTTHWCHGKNYPKTSDRKIAINSNRLPVACGRNRQVPDMRCLG